MPFSDPKEGRISTLAQPIEPDYNYDPLFFKEVVPAAFRLENSIGSVMAKGAFDVTPGAPYDPNFDPISLVPEQYVLNSMAYVHANNQAEVDQVTQRLDREQAKQEIVEMDGGLGTLAVFVADVFDPIRFIIVLVVVLSSKQKRIVIVAAAFATVIVEAILYSIQVARTPGEGIPIGFLASLFVATIVFTIRWWRDILKEQEASVKTVLEAAFYKWKAKFSWLDVSDAKRLWALGKENRRLKKLLRLRALEEENTEMKKLLAEAMLDITMLKDINSKKY